MGSDRNTDRKSYKKNIKIFLILCMILAVLVPGALAISANASDDSGQEDSETAAWRAYNGRKIGVLTGTPTEDLAKTEFPDSELLYFSSYPDLNAALLAGKIDAYIGDEPNLKTIHAEQPEIDFIREKITEAEYSFAFRKDDPDSAALCAEFNAFLAEKFADGTMQEIEDIWLGVDEDKKVVDMEGLSGEKGSITIVTTSSDMPWSYIKDGKNVGYDIDLVTRFCREKGYALEILDVDFSGRIPAVQSGRADFSTDMNATPERREQALFSDPTSYGGYVLAVPAKELAQEGQENGTAECVPEFTEFSDLKGKTVSMLVGAPFEELVKSKAPGVGSFSYFNNMADILLALKDGKTDACLNNNAIAELAVNRDPELALFPEPLKEGTFGIAFAKDDERLAGWQAAYDSIPEETKKELWEKWTGLDDSVKTVPKQDWPGTNGTVQVAACDALEPMSYAGEGGELIGFDIEMILLMAKEMDVHVEFVGMEFASVLSYVQSGKALMGAGSIIVTDERREAVDFIEYYPASFVLIVRAAEAEAENKGFIARTCESFEKTFIREARWKLFLQGIGTTILITVLSIIFGTALGFLLYMVCRNGNRAANLIAGLFVWLVQGMPVVVLLMILYYIIFAKTSISGTAVAVVAFTLVFGAGVFGMLRTGVGAIDKGQSEAALALGYGDLRSFFRIILPQAVPHFLPVYKGEVVALIKATAIVGYIAVQDLTKMGDIVRGRTYEAFFPLIAVAVIYFILGWLLTFIVSRIEVSVDPKQRKRENILKGVEIND